LVPCSENGLVHGGRNVVTICFAHYPSTCCSILKWCIGLTATV
jgi:hypothetical protein